MLFKIKNVDSIIIDDKLVPNLEEYNRESNKETFFKEKFIQILIDNKDNSLIRLVDVMAKYREMLKAKNISDKATIQILKNLIGSNKNNTTSLVRDERVDWYYCNDTKNETIEVDDSYRKPIPLPLQLERSRTKKYFAFYSTPVDDSSVLASIEAEKESQALSHESKEYSGFDFSNISSNKTDYAKKQAEAQRIGNIGEEYILEVERKRLKAEKIKKEPIWISEKNDTFGFDILSYKKNDENPKVLDNLYIEVKTTSGDLYKEFYVSNLELKTSEKYKDNYVIARVYKATDEKTIGYKYYYGSFKDQFSNLEKGSILVFHVKKPSK